MPRDNIDNRPKEPRPVDAQRRLLRDARPLSALGVGIFVIGLGGLLLALALIAITLSSPGSVNMLQVAGVVIFGILTGYGFTLMR